MTRLITTGLAALIPLAAAFHRAAVGPPSFTAPPMDTSRLTFTHPPTQVGLRDHGGHVTIYRSDGDRRWKAVAEIVLPEAPTEWLALSR